VRRPTTDHGKKLYSQYNEELIIRDFFNDRRGGFYLDVGCFHWRGLSTTYYLEKHLGWKGIGIDAQKAFALEWQINGRVGASSTISSPTIPAPSRSFSSARYFLDVRAARDRARQGLGNIEAPEPQAVEVSTITLNELLDRQGVKKIDFLSMDIEEGEPKALAGFDIERFKPDLVCIEVAEKLKPVIKAYFEQHRYERIDKYLPYDQINWYYRPKSH
jgi:hypothetical protein